MTDAKKNIPRARLNTISFPDPKQIREQAEKKAKAMPLPDPDTMTREEIQQWFYELKVRQIEAELQNEQFRSWGEEYKSNAELLSTVTENILDVVVLSDLEGNITFAGKAYETLGYEDGSLSGKNVMEFVHPEHLPYVLEEFNKLLTSGGPSTVEYLFRCNDGSYMWLETQGKIVTDESNDPQQIVFSAWDITERKQAAKTIENERAFLSAVIENIGDAVVICDAKGRIVRFNEKARRLHRLPEQPVPPEQWAEHYDLYQEEGITLLPTDDIPLFRALQGERVQNAEIVVAPKHGRPYFLVCSGQALTDETGKINGAVIAMHDITDRKRMEKALRESEERLDLAMMVKNEGIWDWNLVSNETVFDERYYIMAGYAPNEFPQNFTAWGERVHPEDLPNAEAAIKAYLSGQSDRFDTEFRFRHREGSWIWIRARGKIVEQDENGTPLRMIGTHTDITERRYAENALRQSENHYRAIFETSGTAMIIIEEDTTISLVNSNFVELSGYSKQEIEGKKTWTEFVHPDDVAWMKENQYLRRQDLNAAPRRYEFRFITRYEEMKHILLGVDMIPETDQSIASCIDITERKQAEEALRESEEKFRIIFEQSAIGMGLVNLADTRWIDVNETFCDMLGYTPEEMQAMPWPDITHPDDVDLDLIPFRRMATGNLENYNIEKRFIHKQGHHVWARLTLSLVRDVHGRPDYEIAIIENITQRKMADEALRALTDTLEQQVAIRTELAETRSRQLQKLTAELIEAEERERRRIAGLLHDDLQQLLAAARMQVEVLITKYPSEIIPKTVKQLLNDSIENTRHLSYELSPPVLHHASLVGAIEWLARRMHEQFELQVDLEIKQAERIEINHPLKVFLFRAVQELLFNTVKHGSVNKACVTFSELDNILVLTVSDQGKGFNPEILSRFDKSGLGLASIKTRARSAGGGLHIKSVPGGGSQFTLTVPLGLPEISKPEKRRVEADLQPHFAPGDFGVRGETKVVFADDHKVIRQALISLIEGQPNIKVVGEAANGEESLHLARTLHPDVIIMDVSMPGMGGVEATRHIKAEMPGVRIIGLSMYEDEQIARAMQEAGAESFLTKTASSAELLKAIYVIKD